MTPRPPRREHGMALVLAIGLLVIFVMLGTAYVGYMSLEIEQAGVKLHQVRARNLAAGGVYAAIGEIQHRIRDAGMPESDYTVTLSAYRRENPGPGKYPQDVHVAVSDESARINLNLAPDACLRAMGLGDDAVTKLSKLRAGDQRIPSVDALRTGDLVSPQDFAALDLSDFTVYTGEAGGGSGAYLNLNTASPRVLSAVFAISLEEAQSLAQKRPFANWADVLQKVGREPATFNLDVPRFAPREMPGAVAFGSRCFRLRSTVALNMPGGAHRPAYAGVEAVVAFGLDGRYTIRYWRELGGADARDAEASAAVPASAGDPAG